MPQCVRQRNCILVVQLIVIDADEQYLNQVGLSDQREESSDAPRLVTVPGHVRVQQEFLP